MQNSLFSKAFFQQRYTKIALLGLTAIGIAAALVWLWPSMTQLWQQREVSKPHFIAIKKVNGIEVDAGAKYQGLFLAGSAHEVEYELVNPENGEIDGLKLETDTPPGIRVEGLNQEKIQPLLEPRTISAEGEGDVIVAPAPVLYANEKELFTFRLQVDKEVPIGFYGLTFHASYAIGGVEKRLSQKIQIAVAQASFTAVNSLEGVLTHPEGKLALHFDWPKEQEFILKEPADIPLVLSQISSALEEALRKETIDYEWSRKPSGATLHEAVARFGSEIGKEYANTRLNAVFEKNVLSPALELSLLDTLAAHLSKEGQRIFNELSLEEPQKKDAISLSSLGTIAALDYLPEFKGLFDKGLVRITKQDGASVSIDISKYRKKYPLASPSGFLYAASKNKFFSKRIAGKADLFEAKLNFIQGEGPWKVTFVMEDQGKAGIQMTSPALVFDTLPTGSGDITGAQVLGKLVGKYETSQGTAFGETEEFREIDRATLAVKSSSGGYAVSLVTESAQGPISYPPVLKSLEVTEAKIEEGTTKFAIRFQVAEAHKYWVETITYAKDQSLGHAKELRRQETEKQSPNPGDTIVFSVEIPGVYGKDFEALEFRIRANNPLAALLLLELPVWVGTIAVWVEDADLVYAVYEIGALVYYHNKQPDPSIFVSLAPWTGYDPAVDVGDRISLNWEVRASIPSTFWGTQPYYITLDLKVNGQSMFGKNVLERVRIPTEGGLAPGEYKFGSRITFAAAEWRCGDIQKVKVRIEGDIRKGEEVVNEQAKEDQAVYSVNNPFVGVVGGMFHDHHEDKNANQKIILKQHRQGDQRISERPDECSFVIDSVTLKDPHGQVEGKFPLSVSCKVALEQAVDQEVGIPITFTKEKPSEHHDPHQSIEWKNNQVAAHVEGKVMLVRYSDPLSPTGGNMLTFPVPWKADLKRYGDNICFPGNFSIDDYDKEEKEKPPHCPNKILEEELGEECDDPPVKCKDKNKICAACKCVAPPPPPPETTPRCPNGIKEAGEQCDGDASVCPGYGFDPFPGAICTAKCECKVLTRPSRPPPPPIPPVEPTPPTTPPEPTPPPPTPSCIESWSCRDWDSWNECEGGIQSRIRVCTDANKCGTVVNKPPGTETRACTPTTPVEPVTPTPPAPTPTCTPSWSCGAWSDWSACVSNSQSRTRTCTDIGNCGTTSGKPAESGTQSCVVTPTCTSDGSCSAPTPACGQTTTGVDNCGTSCSRTGPACPVTRGDVKAEYAQHETSLTTIGAIANVAFSGGNSGVLDLTAKGGVYGIRTLEIPAGATIKMCIEATKQFAYVYYPQYHFGFDFVTTPDGCTTVYNKNSWANGVLLQLGDPNPAPSGTQARVTVTLIQ